MTVTVSKPGFNVRDELTLAKGQYKNAWGPVFYAYTSSSLSLAAATWQKIAMGSEKFDTHNAYDSGRFRPPVAGFYQINAIVRFTDAINGYTGLSLYKNSDASQTTYLTLNNLSQGANSGLGGSTVVYLNGTTDYVELYAYASSATTITSDATASSFSGAFIRGI